MQFNPASIRSGKNPLILPQSQVVGGGRTDILSDLKEAGVNTDSIAPHDLDSIFSIKSYEELEMVLVEFNEDHGTPTIVDTPVLEQSTTKTEEGNIPPAPPTV